MKQRNFNEIYEKIQREKNPILETLQKRKNISGVAIFVVLIILFISMKYIDMSFGFLAFFAIIEICIVTTYIIFSSKYRALFKQTVIANLVKAYDSGLDFNGKYGVSEAEYNRAGYREYYDIFHSEDLISGSIDNEFYIKMSEVKTEREETTTDSEGNTTTHYVTVFRGLYGYIDVKDKFLPYFEVCSNKFFGKYNKTRIEIDSAEFEKYYDLYTEDKIRTMEVFTSELIEKFNDFKNSLTSPIQVKVQNGTLYFRLRMKDSFEAPTFGKALDYQILYHNFMLIDEPIKLFTKIFENAKDVHG